MTYDECVKYISEIPRFTKKNSLDHTKRLLDLLEINEQEYKIIHVAGTNGKGTVCALISNVLVKCEKNTGLFISPHLVKINERIRINNNQIDDETFLEAFLQVKIAVDKLIEAGEPHPSFFEYLFLMAMYVFKKSKVEYIVLETGLGGRLDATNVFKKPYLTVITSIGLDHMEYLGDTIEKIAQEKAGIIKKDVSLVYWAEDKKVAKVIKESANQLTSVAEPVTRNNWNILKKTDKSVDFSSICGYYLDCIFTIPFIAEYQVQNASVALTAISYLPEIRDQIEQIKTAFCSVCWEGRMEIVQPGIIFDGAHNGPGIDEFIKTFNEYICNGKKMILFAVVKDKDYDYMVKQISNTDVSMIFVTQLDSTRALEVDRIKQDFKMHGYSGEIKVNKVVAEAFKEALKYKEDEDVLFCVGSLYLIGELKCSIQDGIVHFEHTDF